MGLLAAGLAFALAAAPETPTLAEQARDILQQHCAACHAPGKSPPHATLNVLDRKQLIDRHLIVPQKPDESELLWLVECGSMPPGNKKKISPQSRKDLRDWIARGAEFPPHTGDAYILARIQADVERTDAPELLNVRYLSLNHLLDNPDAAKDVGIYRAALLRALNLLSTKERLVTELRAIDPDETIFRIRLDDFGWDQTPFPPATNNLYDLVLLEYPVAPASVNARPALVESYVKRVKMLRPVPYVRADWFVATALKPPLYGDLLQLPGLPRAKNKEPEALEAKLGVTTTPRSRAGLTDSKYVQGNRILERGSSEKTVYWRTFDQGVPKGADSLVALLKAALAEPPDHQSGEAIFTLPNELPGFSVGAPKDRRLDAIPSTSLKNPWAKQGVGAGLSCLNCHAIGLQPFADVVHANADKSSEKKEIEKTYPDLSKWVDEDNRRFAAALAKLRPPTDADPIKFVAEHFAQNPPGDPPLDGLTLPASQPAQAPVKVDFTITNNANGGPPPFRLDDTIKIAVKNSGDVKLYFEVVGTGIDGQKAILPKALIQTDELAPGQLTSVALPLKGDSKTGQEHWTIYAGDVPIPPGVLLESGDGTVRSRVVHALYAIKGGNQIETLLDPARVVKITRSYDIVPK
jgi:serine/threonine-protein kinase